MADFTNQATLSYNGQVINSNIVEGKVVEVITATKTSLDENYYDGEDIVYIVNIVNSGEDAYNDLSVSDNLGGYTFNETTVYPLQYVTNSVQLYENGVLKPPPLLAEGLLTFTGITVPAKGNVTIIYKTVTTEFAPLDVDSTIINSVTIRGGTLNQPVIATETINTLDTPNLLITKTMSPTEVTDNSRVTYTFILQNRGNTALVTTDVAEIIDTFDPILSDLQVSFNGTPWVVTTNYTYNTTTGVFRTTGNQLEVDAATITRDPTTGAYSITPGTSTLVVSGIV